jgi:hypothetical protein
MAVFIIERHMDGGADHKHIAAVQWENRETGNTGSSTRATMVDWIKNKGGDARVQDGDSYVSVDVVEASPPYIQTRADGVLTDNLLRLPEY